jgi:hypothetical protein
MTKWILRIASSVVALAASTAGSQVVINEIMYHPSSENVAEEYIELRNLASTDVNLGGWTLSRGVEFTFPSNTILQANGYLVVAANRQVFTNKYPGVLNVVGNWVGILSNSRNDIDLEDANGDDVDRVEYADEGDWAVRRRGLIHFNHRGWIWYKEHDGLGKSLELINPALPNEHGQNWAASIPAEGTPGAVNSVLAANIAPLILEVQHFPVVPSSSDIVTVSARLLDESASGVTATLNWRVDGAPGFNSAPMFDDGAHGDGAAADGLWGAFITPAQANNAVVEFYVAASDAQSNARTWPAPTLPALDQTGGAFQGANALYQVDDSPQNTFGGVPSQQPVFKLIMTASERDELITGIIASNDRNSDAQMNGTWISLDSSGPQVRYLCGFRNRGHGTRGSGNFRANFSSDKPWQDVMALNLNVAQVHLQHLGSVLALKSGAAGAYTRPVQVRVNNINRASSGAPMFGSYAANEAINSQWADRHFPDDSGGNVYRAIRDILPPTFDYRLEDQNAYTNTWFKETNVSEDDWTDLIAMLRVIGLSGTDDYTETTVRRVINPEQWLNHLAVMNLFGNNETGLNTGYNDDYFMYRGEIDRRFILMYYDLDQILGQGGSLGTGAGIFTCTANNGAGAALNRFIHDPLFEPVYYATLQRLLDTTFSASQFDALVDQALGSYVPTATINAIKNWMSQRRAFVQGLIAGNPAPGVATVSGEPRSPTPSRSATLTVGGRDIVSYRFRLNSGSYGAERLISSNIVFNNTLPIGTNTIYVIGKTAAGGWQSMANETISRTWIVNTAWPSVRLNEVLANNGASPDMIELFNEGASSVDLSGLRLTDDPAQPDKFTFPPGASLASGAFRSLSATELGFSLDADGEGVYLFHRVSAGGALLDSVQFGRQLPGLSIGRVNGSGTWVLCQPTEAAANVPAPVGDLYSLRINEILTSPQSPFVDDFIEILNPTPAPVNLGGLFLTDSPIGAPNRHRIPDLTFIAAGAFYVFIADGDPEETDHVDFQLSADLGEVALMGPGQRPIDCVIYGPQRPGVSYGRCPDASSTFNFLVLPTPGSPNACPTLPPPPQTFPLITGDYIWRYNDTGIYPATNWFDTNYNDAAWPSGQAMLGFDNPPLAEPLRTQLALSSDRLAYYFRTTFTVTNLPALSGLQMEHAIDDGAVFYINGRELPQRYNMPGGPVTNSTLALVNIGNAEAYSAPVSIPLSFLQPGLNHFAVEVHQQFVGSADIALGLKLSGIIVTNTPGGSGVGINEVFANNGTFAEPDGSTPDWVEFYNPSDSPVDLVGLSVSDSTLNADRFVLPAGSLVPARGYFAIRFDADKPASSTNTGFGLKASGDTLYLFNPNNTVLDSVNFGFQAADFSIGRTGVGGAWNLCIPTIGATNLAATLGDPGRVRINEWMADPPSGDDDWFELYNPNSQPVALGLFWLTDDLATRQKHQLWPLSFIGAITNAWQKIICDPDPAGDHVGFNLRATAPGEQLGLSWPNGSPVDSIAFGAQSPGVSQGRLVDGQTNIVSFPGTPSPGDPNYVLMNNVVISEVLTHTDLPLEDAIEIRNVGPTPVNVSGWWLSDSRGQPRKYQIPASPLIPAGGFRVYYEYQFNDRDQSIVPFSLSSANGDEVYLTATTNNVDTGVRGPAEFGAAENGVSFGRYVNSLGVVDFPAMPSLSLGTSVTAQSPTNQIDVFRTGAGAANPYPKVGPVVISEIMYHPTNVGLNDNLIEEFIELHNPTAAAVPLYDPPYPTNTWRLRGGADFNFPPGASIDPGGYLLVVSFDPTNNPSALTTFRNRYGTNSVLVGPYTGKLNNDGESIRLLKPDSPNPNSVPYVVVDYVAYSDRGAWPTNADGFGFSLQRRHVFGYANDPTNWVAAAATPGPAGFLDSDADGLPDSWELLYFGSSTGANPETDSDGDGMTNWEEYQAGTHPRNAGSLLRIIRSSVIKTGTTASFQFNAVSNKTYTVQYRTSLSTGTWNLVGSFPSSTTNVTRTVTDLNATGNQRFYRVATP